MKWTPVVAAEASGREEEPDGQRNDAARAEDMLPVVALRTDLGEPGEPHDEEPGADEEQWAHAELRKETRG